MILTKLLIEVVVSALIAGFVYWFIVTMTHDKNLAITAATIVYILHKGE